MFKSATISTFVTIVASQAAADTGKEYDLSTLPTDVAAQVVQLQQYGDRFEPAIRAIFAEHRKPCSSFDSGFGPAETQPQS